MGQQSNEGFDRDEGDSGSLLYFGMAIVMLLLTFITFWLTKKGNGRGVADGVGRVPDGGGRVAGAVAAQPRERLRERARDSDDSEAEVDERLNDPKLGAKKRAKLEAKAEKRAQREAEERMREDRKARQAREENERKLRDEQETAAEKKREEEEKRQQEEQARKEQEEYEKFKEMISIDQEGCDTIEEEEEGNLLEMFLNHIKQHKVVMFDELASKFGLKVPDAIDRLKHLVEEGRLTGVMDDRGKFIYIPQEELLQFAKFIKQRGRVAISELVENSASLINLKPVEAEC